MKLRRKTVQPAPSKKGVIAVNKTGYSAILRSYEQKKKTRPQKMQSPRVATLAEDDTFDIELSKGDVMLVTRK